MTALLLLISFLILFDIKKHLSTMQQKSFVFAVVPNLPRKKFSIGNVSFWVTAVVGAVTAAFQARQSKRESDKERNRLKAAKKAEDDAIAQEIQNKANSVIGTSSSFAKYMPIVLIGSIAAFGAFLMKRR